MRRLLALLLWALPLAAQTPVPIQNPSFESGSVGWTFSSSGTWQPGAGSYTSLCDGTHIATLNNTATLSQDLGVAAQPSSTYVLGFCVGHRLDCCVAKATVQLMAGATSLCSVTVDAATITAGTFAQQSLSCPTTATPPSGDLSIAVSTSGTQTNVDAFSLTVALTTPPVPPNIDSLTFGVQLSGCSLCDGSDYSALASAGIYQGATFSLAQQNPTGANSSVCSGTFNATAQASCKGGVNIAPQIVSLVVSVTNPAGALLFPPQTFTAPSLLVGGAVTGNIRLIVGFNPATMLPRAVQLYSQ